MRQLLSAIDCARPMGLRDRAVIATLTYTGACVGAVAQLRLQDLRDYGEHRSLCFREKRGKEREVPVRMRCLWDSSVLALSVGCYGSSSS